MEPQRGPSLEWREGDVPVAAAFEDTYYSLTDGAAETRHVFLAGNALPARFRPGFHVAELGFGTGLNLACVWQSWIAAGREDSLTFTTFEAFPLGAGDMARALGRWPDLADLMHPFLPALDRGETHIALPTLTFRMHVGDARQTLLEWQGAADAWFLDGFSPARNPQLWEPGLLASVAKHTTPGGTFATYTAAGDVRRALEEAGFAVERVPGFGSKRHMTRGTLR